MVYSSREDHEPMLDKPFVAKYKPIPIKTLLKNMQDEASIALDMSFYSLIYGDVDVAQEVEKIDEKVDEEFNLLAIQLMLAARDPDDAEKLLPALRLGIAIDQVVEASSDIAITVIKGYKAGSVVKAALEITEEIYLKVVIDERYDGITIEKFKEQFGAVDVIAVRSSGVLVVNPPDDLTLKKGDVLVVRGDRDDVMRVAKAFNIDLVIPSDQFSPEVKEVASRLALLKNLSEIAFDLAVYSLLYQDYIAAEEVLELESFIDDESAKLEMEVMKHTKDPQEMYVATVLIRSLEKVSDAATNIAQLSLSKNEVHPILRKIKEESEEKVIVILIKGDCDITLKELEDKINGNVIAIYVEGTWIPLPNLGTKLKKGMKVLAKIYEELEELDLPCPVEVR
ncbi:hypothetical protein IPA_00985 [Ignicoccus pacificus DSM 13166]|uniref:RCK C-terminal domain-containing protein n=1 Tax=Ignicoccus pacificus DSM 13166 TaxID=940294 RepID=A0A977KAF1_9CREN|nr:hypothetical protein IPA_00985 [Ignicoccus pacificus DSM 13166]